jgi:predicted RNase H-like HicB family nuclease
VTTRYEARLRRSDRWWAVEIPDLGIYTQGRTLDDAEHMARDAIAGVLDVPLDTVEVDLIVPEAASDLRRLQEAKERRAEAIAAEQETLTAVARSLIERGVSQRDAGRLLGISHQRVSQVAPVRHSDKPRRRPTAKSA